MNRDEFLNEVAFNTGLPEDMAEEGTAIVLGALSGRLSGGEPDHVEAQLPKGIKELWRSEEKRGLFNRLVSDRLEYRNKEEFFALIDQKLDESGIPISAGKLVDSVFGTLKRSLSFGEVKDVSAQLPQDIKEVWEAA